jgi:hypothetical protein
MSWINAFDLDACTAEVYQGAMPSVGSPVYSGTLGKGQSATFTLFALPYEIAVSADGVVTLTSLSSGAVEGSPVANLHVFPNTYPIDNIHGARAVLPTSAIGSGSVTADGSTLVAFTNGDAVVDLSAQTATMLAGQAQLLGQSGTQLQFTPEFDDGTAQTNYNCDCDDEHPTETLADLRTYLMVRLGFSAMLASPPPGMTDLLNSFLIEAQTLLYQRFRMLRLERWFTWNMAAGTRFYDLGANADTCTKKLDASRVRYVGISKGDNCWRPLVCGIDPVRYSYQGPSIPDSYEIRQCIEVFPAPSDDTWKLRIKGDFGLLPFVADTDVTTIDPQAIKLHALAYAKAHYGQSDAANHMNALTTFIGDLTAGTHQTRRYVPGERPAPPAIPPKVVG